MCGLSCDTIIRASNFPSEFSENDMFTYFIADMLFNLEYVRSTLLSLYKELGVMYIFLIIAPGRNVFLSNSVIISNPSLYIVSRSISLILNLSEASLSINTVTLPIYFFVKMIFNAESFFKYFCCIFTSQSIWLLPNALSTE